jgi:hypothetical protein
MRREIASDELEEVNSVSIERPGFGQSKTVYLEPF